MARRSKGSGTAVTLAAVFLGMVGVGLVWRRRGLRGLHVRGGSRVGLDAHLPDEHKRVVTAALAREQDPAELHTLAAKLGAAGYPRSAKAAASRAEEVRTGSEQARTGFFHGGFYRRDPEAEAAWAQEQIAAMYPQSPGGAPFWPGYRVGQDAALVSKAQRLLRSMGYDVEADGLLGPKTRHAVMEFQSLHDLDVDGVPGPATLTILASIAGSN